MNDISNLDTDQLIKSMRELVEESRRLASKHEELLREYERLHQELNRRRGFSQADAGPSSNPA